MLSTPARAVRPRGPVRARLAVPGSKSVTNRALLLAALARGHSTLTGALVAQDSEVMLAALGRLGVEIHRDGTTLTVDGAGGPLPSTGAELDLALSGTSIRFLLAALAAGRGEYVLDGTARMRQRPIADLAEALRSLGAGIETVDGCPPVTLHARGLTGGRALVAGDRSSQFLSALLMAAPLAADAVTVEVTGVLQSRPFVAVTTQLMQRFGVPVEVADDRYRVVPATYQATELAVEGDATAASYLWGAAAITGGTVTVSNVGSASSQGDRRFADVLATMGATVEWSTDRATVTGPADGRLHGGTVDLNDMPDTAQTLAVLALRADSPVRITNVANLRIKETDRLTALAKELRRFGADVTEGAGDLLIVPPQDLTAVGPVEVATYGDHRMAMAFALVGLARDAVTIADPDCAAKTWPEFFDVLDRL